ncbi:MAG: hypothetical protein EU530_10180 [Promethearchaeota archaeon]|nr:MAG: hypothetical protein EU530_10180 [Candidatus Lokiarchaeota archaeon]
MMKTTSIRLEEKQEREIEHYAEKNQVDKSTAARQIIDQGLRVIKRKEALENVRKMNWTIWKAAEYCGESFRSFLPLLREENIPFPLTVDELERELNESSE